MVPATFPVDDRRAAGRRPDPLCRTCDGSEVQAVLRTEIGVYFRCSSCNRVWGESKPPASNPSPRLSVAPPDHALETQAVASWATDAHETAELSEERLGRGMQLGSPTYANRPPSREPGAARRLLEYERLER